MESFILLPMMETKVSCDWLEQSVSEYFQPVRVLKDIPGRRIELIRHRETGLVLVLRRSPGDPAVYRELMKISSPYLPRIYEVAARDGRLLVLEEYIQGDSLREVLTGGCLSVDETRRVALQLCEALRILHRLGAVHRDVKPENVILRGADAVLIDFDASRVLKADQSADTVILGTTGYAAPEQYGLSQTDGRADIYSLGIMMNVMLTGEHPSRHPAGGHLGRVISRCTMASPDHRYPDIEHLMEAI